jgi:sugar phosphate isomerase/epimerase
MDGRIPIGLQLYSIRKDCADDLPGSLKQVAEMGYDGVEFAGYHDRTAEELRALLDDCGLVCCGTHIKIDTLLGDAFDATVAFNKTLGNRFLIVPGLSEEYRDSFDAWKRTAGVFNEIAERAAAVDIRVGYHNHNHEFTPIDGECAWDVFAKNTCDDVVLQFDTGNARHGGGDPLMFLERYPGRSTTVHLKEWTGDDTEDRGHQAAAVGDGLEDWATVFRLCESAGATEWYIVEQEVYGAPPMDTVRQCIDNLRGMGK